jgi:hypothetical protein
VFCHCFENLTKTEQCMYPDVTDHCAVIYVFLRSTSMFNSIFLSLNAIIENVPKQEVATTKN